MSEQKRKCGREETLSAPYFLFVSFPPPFQNPGPGYMAEAGWWQQPLPLTTHCPRISSDSLTDRRALGPCPPPRARSGPHP